MGKKPGEPRNRAAEQGVSTHDYLQKLPRRLYTHMVKGYVLFMPRTDLIVVPTTQHKGGWDVRVVVGDDTYGVGGYDLYCSNAEIERAIRLEPDKLMEAARQAQSKALDPAFDPDPIGIDSKVIKVGSKDCGVVIKSRLRDGVQQHKVKHSIFRGGGTTWYDESELEPDIRTI